MKVILTEWYKKRWRADVIDLDLRPLRSTGRTRRPAMIYIACSSGILKVPCEVLPRSISICAPDEDTWMGKHLFPSLTITSAESDE